MVTLVTPYGALPIDMQVDLYGVMSKDFLI